MKVEIDLPEFDGYQPTGEYRSPKTGEAYLGMDMQISEADHNLLSQYPIYRREWKCPEALRGKGWLLMLPCGTICIIDAEPREVDLWDHFFDKSKHMSQSLYESLFGDIPPQLNGPSTYGRFVELK